MNRHHLPALMILEAPPPGGCGPLGALDGDSGDRLARWCGVLGDGDEPRLRLLAGLDRVNLIDVPGAGVTSKWDGAAADVAAASLLDAGATEDRVVLLAGARVLRAFRRAAGLPALPPLSRLLLRGTEWVPVPHPSGRCRSWDDPALRAEAGAVVLAEVERAERAARSWATFGEDAMFTSEIALLDPEVTNKVHPCFGYRVSDGSLRLLAEPSDAAWAKGREIKPGDPYAPVAVDALARGLGRILRWGGTSTCTVLAHSIRVALLAAAACRAFRDGPELRGRCLVRGAAHDLPEGLPGIGDVPSPGKRWFAAASPAFSLAHGTAEARVAALLGHEPDEAVDRIVKWADLATMAVERAAYFGDAPEWLGRHQVYARALLSRSAKVQTLLVRDRTWEPSDLLALLGGVRVEIDTEIEDMLVSAADEAYISRDIFGR